MPDKVFDLNSIQVNWHAAKLHWNEIKKNYESEKPNLDHVCTDPNYLVEIERSKYIEQHCRGIKTICKHQIWSASKLKKKYNANQFNIDQLKSYLELIDTFTKELIEQSISVKELIEQISIDFLNPQYQNFKYRGSDCQVSMIRIIRHAQWIDRYLEWLDIYKTDIKRFFNIELR